MQIDWVTTAAQLVNFLVLVWLLKRFLYRPVVNAMTARERGIAERLEQAEERERLAERREHEYLDKMRALDEDHAARLQEARAAADRERSRLVERAREDVDAEHARWVRQLRQEEEDFSGALKRELGASALDLARRILADLADAGLERQVIDGFLEHFDGLPETDRAALERAGGEVTVKSAFELARGDRGRMAAAVREKLGTDTEIRFERDPALLCGVELARSGYKLSWNVAEYLAELDERIRDRLAVPVAGSAAASTVPA
jgi:F-type H+-transporting ATPase subunit b